MAEQRSHTGSGPIHFLALGQGGADTGCGIPATRVIREMYVAETARGGRINVTSDMAAITCGGCVKARDEAKRIGAFDPLTDEQVSK